MEVQHTEKAYCCSNYPQTEATLIAKFELVLGVAGLITVIILLSLAISTNAPPSQAVHPNITNDPSMIFSWPREKQISYLLSALVSKVVGIVSAIVLFFGVKRRHHAYLLTWFVYTVVSVIISLLYGLSTLISSSDKLFLSIVFVTSFFYNWYCLWIVKLLMSEIRAIREGYANPLDDGEIEHASNLVPSSDSFTVTVDKF